VAERRRGRAIAGDDRAQQGADSDGHRVR
jgi:hypothetical protein